jgi:hypothetical protein
MTAGEEQHSSHTLILLLDTRGHAEANSLDGRVSTVPQTGRGGFMRSLFFFFFFMSGDFQEIPTSYSHFGTYTTPWGVTVLLSLK